MIIILVSIYINIEIAIASVLSDLFAFGILALIVSQQLGLVRPKYFAVILWKHIGLGIFKFDCKVALGDLTS